MKPQNLDSINHSFEIQAANFESNKTNFAKEEYLNYMLSAVAAQKAGHFFRGGCRNLYLWAFFCSICTNGGLLRCNNTYAGNRKTGST